MYIAFPDWYRSESYPTNFAFVRALLPYEDKFGKFDWDILTDMTARNLVTDHHTHPRWVGSFRRQRYPQYTPSHRYVKLAHFYNSQRTAYIPVRQIIVAMHLDINHIHLARLNLVSSCREKWCVDINHIAPQSTVPTSEFIIDWADPASGRPNWADPNNPEPAWEENKKQPVFAPEVEATRTTKTINDTFAILAGEKKPLNLPDSDVVEAEYVDEIPTTRTHK
jgi:hypothetical protein